MKAAICESVGPGNAVVNVIQDHPKPSVKEPFDVLVKIRACGLSQHDLDVLQGKLKLISIPRNKGHVVGCEISGVVEEVGKGVTRFQVGDGVVGIIPADSMNGGCAEFCILEEYYLVKKPTSVDHGKAAGSVGACANALTALHYLLHMTRGESLLIIDAASPVGFAAIKLASLWEIKVFPLVSNQAEFEIIQKYCSSEIVLNTINLEKDQFHESAIERTGGMGFDCILETQDYPEKDEEKSGLEDEKDDENGGEREKKEGKPEKRDGEISGRNESTSSAVHVVFKTKTIGIYDIINVLAVSGRWVTSEHALQLDPPQSRALFLKGATLAFLFFQNWLLASSQLGRYLHVLTEVVHNIEKKVVYLEDYRIYNLDDIDRALLHLANDQIHKYVIKIE